MYTLKTFRKPLNPSDMSSPTITLGRGDGVTPMSSKGRIYKDRKGMVVEYFKSNSGDRLAVTIPSSVIVTAMEW